MCFSRFLNWKSFVETLKTLSLYFVCLECQTFQLHFIYNTKKEEKKVVNDGDISKENAPTLPASTKLPMCTCR